MTRIPDSPASRQTSADCPVPAPSSSPNGLDCRKLDAYNVALEFQFVVQAVAASCPSVLRDQLERAALSILLNVAEGAGRRSRRDKARFFGIARGSAYECSAALDVLYLRGLVAARAYARGQRLLVRLGQMLTRLQGRLAA